MTGTFRRIATPPRLIMAVFFMHAVVMWNWYPRIADVLAKLDVTRGDLSLGLLGGPVGTLVALVFAGPIIERLTPRRTIIFGFAAYCFGFALPDDGLGCAEPVRGSFRGRSGAADGGRRDECRGGPDQHGLGRRS